MYDLASSHMCLYEKDAVSRGFLRVGGVDEVGRGALAGPVVAACVMLDGYNIPEGIVDSKKIADAARRRLCEKIRSSAACIGIGVVGPEIIDEVNIHNATVIAMKTAVESMKMKPDFLLIDAVKLNDISISTLSLIKGEERSVSIAAASIVAKVFRDDIMIDLERKYPHYGFSQHKGYGTVLHVAKLLEYGPSVVHRYSYKPVAKTRETWKLKKHLERQF